MIGKTSGVGYLSDALQFEERSSLLVRVGQTIYMSGIVSVTADEDGYRIIGEEDMRAQMQWTFEVARRALATEGLGPRDIVSYTGYAMGMARFNENMDVVRDFFGAWAPCATVVGVAELGWPGLLFELTITAFDSRVGDA